MCRKYRAASGLTGALCWDERWGCNSPLELQVSQGLGAEEREMGQHALVGGVGRGDGGLTDATARGTSPWHLPCGSWPPALNLEPTGGGAFPLVVFQQGVRGPAADFGCCASGPLFCGPGHVVSGKQCGQPLGVFLGKSWLSSS